MTQTLEGTMRALAMLAAGLTLAMLSPSIAVAQSTDQKPLTAQQQRMKDCNANAGQQKLSGDARKTFMSSCLSGKSTTTTAGNSQQQKMKACNTTASAQKLKGDARKSFMSNCLKGT
jgi:hypothetical protein